MNGVCIYPGVCLCDEGWIDEDCSRGENECWIHFKALVKTVHAVHAVCVGACVHVYVRVCVMQLELSDLSGFYYCTCTYRDMPASMCIWDV